MENLILSFNVVLPLCLCIALGYFLYRINMIEEATQKSMNKLVFRVFLPIYVFNSIYTTDVAKVFDLRLVLLTVLGIVGIFAVLMVLIPRIEKDNAKRGVMVQAIFRSNYVLFGVPIAASLCGEANIGPTSLLVGFVVPIFNVLAVVCLETFRGGKPDYKKMLRGIATNPLIIGSVLGIVLNLFNVPLPTGVHKSVTDLGKIATPLSLVVLGAGFRFNAIRGYMRQIAICLTGKLIISPLITVAIGVLLGLRNEMLVPVLAVFGSPIAVSSYTMAEQMEGDGRLAASLVVLTSVCSIVTMFLFIFALKQLGLV